MPFDLSQFNKRVLLTGAGFSRNWGGRLAKEMWEEIFSHPAVQQRVLLRTLLLRMPSFENVLAETVDPKRYDDDDRAALNAAVQEAFERMDAEHAVFLRHNPPNIDCAGVRELFKWFYSQSENIGYIFSLNQDCLKERLFGFRMDLIGVSSPIFPGFPGIPFSLPGVRHSVMDMPKIVDEEISDETLEGNLNYIKLHGSFAWRPSDGSSGMVLGGGKSIVIKRSPLLTWYRDVFECILCAGDVRVLIIGYGFFDSHINEIISKAARNFGARIFLWDRRDPLEILESVELEMSRIDLRSYLCGASSRPLAEVFPANGCPTPEYMRISASFLR